MLSYRYNYIEWRSRDEEQYFVSPSKTNIKLYNFLNFRTKISLILWHLSVKFIGLRWNSLFQSVINSSSIKFPSFYCNGKSKLFLLLLTWYIFSSMEINKLLFKKYNLLQNIQTESNIFIVLWKNCWWNIYILL